MDASFVRRLNPKLALALGFIPWLVYYYGVASQGYPQFVVLPLFALYPGPLGGVWAHEPGVYVVGCLTALTLVALGLRALLLSNRSQALKAAIACDLWILVLLVIMGIRHMFQKV